MPGRPPPRRGPVARRGLHLPGGRTPPVRPV